MFSNNGVQFCVIEFCDA